MSALHHIATRIADLCARHGMKQVIISPGSRSAPLTVACARHPDLTTRIVVDERAAGFVALGIAQQTGQPVGLICTSGTAPLNYGPATAEAYYQRLPLILLTADRPPEWVDQQDNQTSHQRDLHAAHCRATFSLPVDYSHPDAVWHADRILNEALNIAMWPEPGPVQINCPFREPLYPTSDGLAELDSPPKLIRLARPRLTLADSTWAELLAEWSQAQRRLILVGMMSPQPEIDRALTALQTHDAVTLADVTANLHQSGHHIGQIDTLLAKSSDWESLRPDLLLTCGGAVISKRVKQFLRKHPPAAQWHIQPTNQAADTFQAMTRLIPLDPADFWEAFVDKLEASGTSVEPVETEFDKLSQREVNLSYHKTWHPLEATKPVETEFGKLSRRELDSFLAATPFNEFAATAQLLAALPEPSRLQVGNSMPIRYVDLLGLRGRNITVNANRGTSGIDGSVSTAVGAALTTADITTLIVGDLAFFYDRNGLWQSPLPPNLRIVLLNNQGGGIFGLINGPNNLPDDERITYFETPHTLTAARTAADYGCAYQHCTSRETLHAALSDFFMPSSAPKIVEIQTERTVNAAVFAEFSKKLL